MDKPAKDEPKTEKEHVLVAEAKPREKVVLSSDKEALKKIKLVAVAHSHVQREMFPTQEAFDAEFEVVERAAEVVEAIKKLGLNAKAYPGDQYLLTNL